MDYVFSVLVENHAGVLARVSQLFSARGFNITSLSVGETEDTSISRMTIAVDGDKRTMEQVKKQLNKLIDVIKVVDLTDLPQVNRELIFIKVKADGKSRSQIIEIVDVFRARIVHVASSELIIEAVGHLDKVEALIKLLKPFGIKELARTGRVCMARTD